MGETYLRRYVSFWWLSYEVGRETLQLKAITFIPFMTFGMADSITSSTDLGNQGLSETLSSDSRVNELRNLVESLHIADEIAAKSYLVSSSELAALIDINPSAVTSRGDHWVWRNWVVSRVRREGNQILWQLERVD